MAAVPRGEEICVDGGWGAGGLSPRRLGLLAAGIFVLELLLSAMGLEWFPGPERYFAYQWSVSYAHGISRRALPGEVLRLLHLDNGSYGLITGVSWAITIALYAVVAWAVMRLVGARRSRTGVVLAVALLLSPVTTGILMTTTGDPIQLNLLVYLLLTLALLRPGRSVPAAAIAFAVYGAASMLVHEATLFFVGPMLLVSALLLRRSGLDRAALGGYVAGAAPMLLATVRSTEGRAATAIAPMHFGGMPIVARVPVHLETFSELLGEENAAHFHSGLTGYALTGRNLIGAMVLPAFLAAVLATLWPRLRVGGVERRWWPALPLVWLMSVPLWAIAHDWGRFTSYLFLMFMVVLSGQVESDEQGRALPPGVMGVLLVLSGVTTTRVLPQYIIKGLGDDNRTMLAALLLMGMAGWMLWRARLDAQA